MIRLATGSATIATVTASGIMAPLVASDAGINGMSVRDTFKTWSAMETLISVVGFAFVLGASVVV